MINLTKLRKSFGYALRGLHQLLIREQNARIHATLTLAAFAAAIFFHLSRLEAAILFFAVILVFAIEIINTAIEKLLDLVHPENHVQIAFIKDALAGAVLIAASIAVVIAVLVFYPHVFRHLTIKPHQESTSSSYYHIITLRSSLAYSSTPSSALGCT